MTNYGMSKYGWDIQGPSSQYSGIWKGIIMSAKEAFDTNVTNRIGEREQIYF